SGQRRTAAAVHAAARRHRAGEVHHGGESHAGPGRGPGGPVAAAELVRRAGTNLNQAVARLNATGQPGPDLGPAADYCLRVVERIDQAAEHISRGLNRAGRTRPRAG
ncbi:MAG: hypothetical protein ACRDOH_23630, partial [Streptosporangiaceae bacterium]